MNVFVIIIVIIIIVINRRTAMRIYITDLVSIFPLAVKRSDTVHDVKSKIESIKGVPIDDQDLTIWEREMFDDDQLSLYNIKSKEYHSVKIAHHTTTTPHPCCTRICACAGLTLHTRSHSHRS